MPPLMSSSSSLPIRAAEYLRMSTEHQQYSINNQGAAIREYADTHGFTIVRTYEDPGCSGLLLRHRLGLQKLLSDVVNGKADYTAILVYDISRWGRFADNDEAAHYEFLCRRAGIQVHYCAEQFANDGSLSSSLLKALKRTMAAEYSRELGVKVYAGKKRLVQLGFRVGGQAGYGLSRLLLSDGGKHRRKLREGERKSLMTDRVILVPGPKNEVETVRQMFQMALSKPYTHIARDLNARGIPALHGKPWTIYSVKGVLRNPKYAGRLVWGRTSSKLRSRAQAVPPEQWVVTPGAFKPIVDPEVFDRVQVVHMNRSFPPLPDEVMLGRLRELLASGGRLSQSVMDEHPGIPHAMTYRKHFGSLRRAYELIGYRLSSRQLKDFRPEPPQTTDAKDSDCGDRETLSKSEAGMFCEESTPIQAGQRQHGSLARLLLLPNTREKEDSLVVGSSAE
jgi:DNA invertase Pin-like site-specific DNA recombinase